VAREEPEREQRVEEAAALLVARVDSLQRCPPDQIEAAGREALIGLRSRLEEAIDALEDIEGDRELTEHGAELPARVRDAPGGGSATRMRVSPDPCPDGRYSARSIDPIEIGQSELLTALGTVLDLLVIGLARRLAVEEHQKAYSLPRAFHPAKDAITAYATERGRLHLYPVCPFSDSDYVFSRLLRVTR
jgi:hypothetical protein